MRNGVPWLMRPNFWPEGVQKTVDRYNRAFDTEFEKTLGRLISRLSQRVRIPSGLADRMKRALEIRNLLAHNYFWERSAQFLIGLWRLLLSYVG